MRASVLLRHGGVTVWVLPVAALIATLAGPPAISAAETTPSPKSKAKAAAKAADTADSSGAAATAADQERRIRELEQTVNELKRDTREVEVEQETQKAAKPIAGWRDGFMLSSQDGAYKMRIGGYTQFDGRFFIGGNGTAISQFLFRRVRPILEGTVFKYFDFKIMPDFAGTVQLFDAYVDVNYLSWARLRAGKFKPPLGLERLQSATALMLVERGLTTNLVPTRDFGLQVWGDVLDGALNYQLGVFDGAPDLGNPSIGDADSSKDFNGRVFAQPFKDLGIPALAGLNFGLSGSYGHQSANPSNPNLPRYVSFGQQTIFQFRSAGTADVTNTAYALGPRWRISPQAYYYWGPFGLMADYVNSTEGVSFNRRQVELSNGAWSVALTYVLTGEAASYRGVTPAQPFNPFDGRWGAVDIVARYGQLLLDDNAFPIYANPASSVNQDEEVAMGVNWYWNRNIKWDLSYAYSQFKGGAPSNGNRPSENVIIGRIQLLL